MCLPDEGQRQDVVRVDGDEPITVLGVWVGVGEVWGQYKAVGAGQVPSTGRCREGKDSTKEQMMQKSAVRTFVQLAPRILRD